MTEVNYLYLVDVLQSKEYNIENVKKQYLLLLSNLSVTEYITTQKFVENLECINEMGSIIVGVVNDNSNNYEIVASGTIIIEPKIIRGGKCVGHIEDIVVAKHMRGKGISQEILKRLKDYARDNNCYKVTLECFEEVKKIYSKCGFKVNGVQMVDYFM